MRRNARVDANQSEIVDAALALGATVQSLAAVGAGCPDLVIGYRGKNYLIEVKNPSQPRYDREKNQWQKKFRDRWQGQVAVIETVEQLHELLRGE